MKRHVIVISKQRAVRELSKEMLPSDTCYYLSDDYQTMVRIRKSLSSRHEIRLLGKRFHEIVADIQDDFLHLCHEISRKNMNETYWGTHLASRNSASVYLLKYVVYLIFAKEILRRGESRLFLIYDSPASGYMLRQEANKLGCVCVSSSNFWDVLQTINRYVRIVMRGCYYLFFAHIQWLYARLFLHNTRLTPRIGSSIWIIRSWLTAANIDKEGNYRDRNFGVLPDNLLREKKNVWVLPMFIKLDRSIFTQMKLLSTSNQNFLIPEQYISSLDICMTFIDGLKSIHINFGECIIRDHDVSEIVKEVHLSMSLSSQLLFLNSVKYVIKRLKNKNITVSKLIYPMENNPPEKTFIYAARASYPNAEIIGFQHTVWYKEQLGMFLHPKEVNYHPLPDRVVCSGQRYLDILASAGFPQKILRLGPNLRFSSVHLKENVTKHEHSLSMKNILIILNYDLNHVHELLEKVGRMLHMTDEKMEIIIKPHPDNSVDDLEKYLDSIDFPRHTWVKGTVQEWISHADVVIMTGGSVSNLETIIMGIPLIRVSLDNNFDFDCLWDEYPFSKFTSSPAEIHQYLRKALHMTSDEDDQLARFGEHIADEYFEPVSAERMNAFS